LNPIYINFPAGTPSTTAGSPGPSPSDSFDFSEDTPIDDNLYQSPSFDSPAPSPTAGESPDSLDHLDGSLPVARALSLGSLPSSPASGGAGRI
jgi:hypothetical protein